LFPLGPRRSLRSRRSLTPQNGVTWRLIQELLDYGFSTELESLDGAQRAEVLFNRVHGFGIVRSKDL
jgi:DNA polymerase beta